MKLKKVNRGLLLGAVLIVGTASYVVADNINFGKNKETIENTAKEFTEDLAKSNVGDRKTAVNNWNELVDKYFIDYTVSEYDDYVFNKSALQSQINENNTKKKVDTVIKSASIFPKNIEVKKYGPSGALVTFEYTLSMEYVGNDERHMDFNGIDFAGDYWSDDPDELKSSEYKNKSFSYTDMGTATIFLLKKGDTWKIATIDGTTGHNPELTCDDLSSDNENTDSSNSEEEKS